MPHPFTSPPLCVRLQDNKTPLHWAAFKGYASIVTELIAAGANLEAKDKVRGVGCVCRGVPLLIHRIVYPWLLTLTTPLACVLQMGNTPLAKAQSRGQAEVVALLQAAAAAAPARR